MKSFAAQAKALDISEFQDIKLPKRRTLLLCLLYQAQVKKRDHLVEMFLKRIQTIHNKAKIKLVELRELHLTQTRDLLGVLAEILSVSSVSSDNAALGEQVQSVLTGHGGSQLLLEQCEEITAYSSDNHLPLLWKFYAHYRKLLFGLVRSLEIRSTTQDESLMSALTFMLEQEHRRGKYLPIGIDLSFISDRWRKLVINRQDDDTEVLVRQQLEICIFTYLALELKTGDACVEGSENYADFRQELLTWDECEPMMAAYCHELDIPSTGADFVENLQQLLTQTAESVDQICSDGQQITISKDGEPVLKRITAQVKPDGAAALETAILKRLPERSVLEILCNVEHWLNWTQHFGPLQHFPHS